MRSMARSRALQVCVTLVLGAACRGGDSGGRAPTASELQHQAVSAVLAGRAVRWISPRVLCVVPIEESTIQGCQARPQMRHDPDLQQTLRRAIPDTGSSMLACVRVSRPIGVGDSTLVAVATTGSAIADGFVESKMSWVWFRGPGGTKAHIDQIGPDGGSHSSDIAPMTDASRC